jgi:hypothetical protein
MLNDPSQKVNIAEKYSEIRNKLTADYKKWENEMVSQYQLQTTIEAGFPKERNITLPVQDAVLSGKVKFSSIHPNQSHTENWVQNGDSIFWKLNMQNAGKYRVELQYGCPEAEIGSKFLFHSNSDSFAFNIDKPFESEILPNRDYVPRTESVERTWDWMTIGNISLKQGEEQLILKLQNKKHTEAALIKAIRLIKINN